MRAPRAVRSAALLAVAVLGFGCRRPDGPPLRVGYFHGGRTALLMRAYEKGEFRRRGLLVEFYSRDLRGTDYTLVPPSIRDFNRRGTEVVGKVRGTELIEGLMAGRFDLAMVGESSFLAAVHAGLPVAAIAELGHDVRGRAGHVFMLRKGLPAKGPGDYAGRVLVSRRAGAGDAIFLKEYLEHAGVDLKTGILQLPALPRSPAEKAVLPKDKVLVADQVLEDDMKAGIDNGVVDGGYFHLMSVPGLIARFDLIAPLHEWGDPELSQALLVCRRQDLPGQRERFVRFLEAYISRIRREYGLSHRERTKPRGKGLQMATDFQGLNYPQYDIPPLVEPDLLRTTARLLRKHGFIDGRPLRLDEAVDNSLVEAAMENLGIRAPAAIRRPEF
jgi:hypothetical protein